MPGWYIHMQAAKQAADRLRNGDVPPDFPKMDFPSPGDRAKALGKLAYKWRNYFALGAIGPDIFYLLPDFKPPLGNDVMTVVDWVLRAWDQIDALFLKAWGDYAAPAIRGEGAVLNQISGGVISRSTLAFWARSKRPRRLIKRFASRPRKAPIATGAGDR